MKFKYEALRVFLAATGIIMTLMLTNSQSGDFADRSMQVKPTEKMGAIFREVPRFPTDKKFLKHHLKNVVYNDHERR